MDTRISFYTFGCRLNQSETAVVERTFEAEGYNIVDISKPADIVVVNTCTVTENGDADTRRLINRINRTNPQARIALIGCQSQIQKEQLTRLPNVKWVIGNAEKLNFLSILKRDACPTTPKVITPTIPKGSFKIPMAGIDHKHTRANIKIQDGCDFFCSFCEIPYARGRARSRDFNDIKREAALLVDAGYKELVITGINVGTYGHNGKTLLDVIDHLEQIDGLERIRISSIEPTTIPVQLVKKMAGPSKLCRHLHIPLQSGNNQVLKAMKRKYTAEQFENFIQMAHTTVPEICIGTDIIVGFPGESDQQFSDTEEKLREWPIHYVHVFSYSQRHMAKSQNLGNTVDVRTITRRSQALRALSARKRELYFRSLVGTKQKVLFEQLKENYWTGLTDNYVRVRVKSKKALTNRFLPVCMDVPHKQSVFATLN